MPRALKRSKRRSESRSSMQGSSSHSIREIFRRRPWLPALIVGTAIMAVSSVPKLGIRGPLFPGCDKLAHFIEYLILGAALRYWSGDGRKRFLAGGVCFAILDELHQAFIPGRHSSIWDVVADVLGLVVGFVWSRRFVRKERYG